MTPTTCSHFVGRRSPQARGFTLVELLVSIALVVLLLLGVNQVFKLSADAVGTGTTVSTMTRENRAAQSTMQEDISTAMVSNPPFLLINQVIRADPSQPDNWNAVRRETQFRFFRTGIHHRQTANDNQFSSTTQSIESSVWYGLTRYPSTGDATRDFATPQVLFRSATLLLSDIPAGENFYATVPNLPFSPLSPDTLADQPTRNAANGGTVNEIFLASRLDLANTSISAYQTYIDDRRAGVRRMNKDPDAYGVSTWFDDLFFLRRNSGRYPDNGRHPNTGEEIFPSLEVIAQPRKPLDSEGVAKAAPYFVGNVSNFVVEFAGDFVTQRPNDGFVTANLPDGVLDYQAVFLNNSPVATIRTRWYGMPRDVNGDNEIDYYDDVVPVRDIYTNARGGAPAPFERYVPGGPTKFGSRSYAVNDFKERNYTCLWTGAGQTPKLFRILIKVEDPSGRVPTGQWWEYVLMPQ